MSAFEIDPRPYLRFDPAHAFDPELGALEALRTRRAVRVFLSDPVPRELLEQVVDCGRLAASANNLQPWDFVVVTDAATRKRIADIVQQPGRHIEFAPACVVVLSKDAKYFLEDGCAATENILVAARALGLGSCWVAGDKKPYAEDICRLVGAPEGHRLVSLVPLGYPGESPSPAKRALSEVLHWEKF